MTSDDNKSGWIVSDTAIGIGFFGSIVLGQVLPFSGGISLAHAVLPCGSWRSWVHGWAAVLGAIGAFLAFFVATDVVDSVITMLFRNNFGKSWSTTICSEVTGMLILMGLLYPFFEDTRALLPAALMTTALSLLMNFCLLRLFDWLEKRQHSSGPDEHRRSSPSES
ncbi:hypothetical protein [Bombiscardovia apis]|uniref:hypothetical protein n=1 Tax=Bombiscardovia apis TaxID=2932182 RepID=UPI002953E138|nr:hypothetical protein [Bombiscardovia apis]